MIFRRTLVSADDRLPHKPLCCHHHDLRHGIRFYPPCEISYDDKGEVEVIPGWGRGSMMSIPIVRRATWAVLAAVVLARPLCCGPSTGIPGMFVQGFVHLGGSCARKGLDGRPSLPGLLGSGVLRRASNVFLAINPAPPIWKCTSGARRIRLLCRGSLQ